MAAAGTDSGSRRVRFRGSYSRHHMGAVDVLNVLIGPRGEVGDLILNDAPQTGWAGTNMGRGDLLRNDGPRMG